jgi:hypothetical protein
MSYIKEITIKEMVARDRIELPTRGFSEDLNQLFSLKFNSILHSVLRCVTECVTKTNAGQLLTNNYMQRINIFALQAISSLVFNRTDN